jgi:hypothetical protein
MKNVINIKKVFQMKKYLIVLFSIIIFSLTGCDYFENSETPNSATIEVNLTALPAVPDTMTFVAWFAKDDSKFKPIRVSTFDADANGSVYFKLEQPLGYLVDAQILQFTIERKAVANDSGLTPSNRIILSGRFKDGTCDLDLGETVDHLNSTSAFYTLSTPTNGPNTDELSGVWFVDSLTNAGSSVAGLKLPVLYSGWRYEGWAEINGTYVSTGRFSNPKAADLFKGYSSTSSGYPFPGEDFLLNAPAGLTFPTDLSGQKIFVSLEWNDGKTSGMTPNIKLFSATVQNPAQSGKSYEMQKTNDLLPNGSAKIKIVLFE